MFYMDDIFTILDMFIYQAHIDSLKDEFSGLQKATWNARPDEAGFELTEIEKDEVVLAEMLSKSFAIKASIRIPTNRSYKDLTSTGAQKQSFKQFFFQWSGFHLFVEPFIATMENTLFPITKSTESMTDDFQSYAREMLEFKRNLASIPDLGIDFTLFQCSRKMETIKRFWALSCFLSFQSIPSFQSL